MNTYTIQRFIKTMVVVILANLPTTHTLRADDPNALWEASERFAAAWESITLAITAYNPVERPDIDPLTRENIIMVSGNVYILDTNDLIAVSTTHATAMQAFDENGNDILFDPNGVQQSPGHTWILGEKPKSFSVELHLDPNQACPMSLSELDFTVDALYGQPFTTATIPLEATEDWTDLSPRYRARVAEANVVGDVCYVVIKEEIVDLGAIGGRSFDPNGRPWEERVSPDVEVHKVSDLDLIVLQYIVDADGRPVQGGGASWYSVDWSGEVAIATLRTCT